MSVCVIGAGIIGLPTAICIQESEPKCKITLIADQFSPDVTSDIAAGFLRPIYISDSNTERLKKWGLETFKFIGQLYREDPVKYGVGTMSGYELYERDEVEARPYWADFVLGFRNPDAKELKSLGWNSIKSSYFYTTYFVESSRLLKVLLEKFTKNGGRVIKRKIENLNQIAENYDVIVNCSGLGSHHLVKDRACFPIRGQIYRVNAPFVKHFVVNEDNYILLNNNRVILGGTHQKDDWNTKVDDRDSKHIWDGCLKLMPSLKDSTIIDQIVGLRPGRPSIRLEAEQTVFNGRTKPVIHCYGHGGSGVTLFYGCAKDVTALVSEELKKKTSKL